MRDLFRRDAVGHKGRQSSLIALDIEGAERHEAIEYVITRVREVDSVRHRPA